MHTDSSPINDVVILGGGSAGWMTAAALAKVFENKALKVRLIESQAVGTVSVGEATIPQISRFNKLLGLDENDFVKHTKGTFKLGIEFANWRQKGHAYMHPFGSYGTNMDAIQFHHYWLKMFQLGKAPELDKFSLLCTAAYSGKFNRPQPIKNSPLADIPYAFHFDATLYAEYLRKFAEARGVTRIEGKVQDVFTRNSNGFVDALLLENGERIHADLFIDCSGFRALLIEKTLNTGYEDWGHWLPCDRAVAMPCEAKNKVYPYTISTAQDAGWTWRIPLQHRIGNGYVYPSEFVSDDEAVDVLKQQMENTPLAEPNQLRWKTGRREKAWHKNVVAIGLSAGFIEPLESTGLHLIQSGISRLMAFFPNQGFNQIDIDEFNAQSKLEMEQIRDFIILHYKLTDREDTEFWRYCKHMDVPQGVTDKLNLYASNGRIFRKDNELFDETSWLAVMHGQGLQPQAYHPIVDNLPESEISRRLAHIQKVIETSVATMPMQADFIDKHCKATMM
ncbi:tryptophan halogenase family protein [Agaribacter flavus]|uniref:Tryptophan halogenase family protein n=1 Tax=Agaribacter flavus TaxID=1902781 RepID=A0ABV7FNW2_9ALTE